MEIHHVVPQENQGPDTEDNAAPLCPSCHEIYGANPTKRKFIREARDFWYEQCERDQTSTSFSAAELNAALAPVATKSDLEEIKAQLSLLLGASARASTSLGVEGEDATPVPLERFIRSFWEEDFGQAEGAYEALFDSRLWYEHGEDSYDLLDRRAAFLKAYGEETARRLCLICAKQTGFDPEAFTEEQLGRMLNAILINVILVTQHKKHAKPGEEPLECGIRRDGEFIWRLASRKKRKTRSAKPSARQKGA